jgi:hypothetical protein
MFPMRGNVQFKETGRLLRAVGADIGELLPPDWSVDVDSSEASGQESADGVLSVRPPRGSSVSYLVEAKQGDRVSVESAVKQALAMRSASRAPVLIVATFANPALRRACAESGLSYADTTGWIRLVSDRPPLFVSHEGAARAPGRPRSTALVRMNGPGAGRVIRALLATPVPIGVRQLATLADVSPGTVAKLLPTAAEEGAVERDDRGAVTAVRRRLLLDRWIQDYSFRASNRDLIWALDPRGADHAAQRLPDVESVVATGSIAARKLLPAGEVAVTPLTLVSLYSEDPAAAAAELGLRPGVEGRANVVIARPYDEKLLQQSSSSTPGRGVDVMQVLADLMTLPGRSPEEAEQLIEVLAATDPSWLETR